MEFYADPRNAEAELRQATEPFVAKAASKWVGDCWLLAFAEAAQGQLVTFDRGLHEFAGKHGGRAVLPE